MRYLVVIYRLKKDSKIQYQQIRTLSKWRFSNQKPIAVLNDSFMLKVEHALRLHLRLMHWS